MKSNIGSVSGSSARTEKRFLGFCIDYALITAVRLLILKICMGAFLIDHLNSFVKESTRSAGKSFLRSKITGTQAQFSLDTGLFVEIFIVVCIIILVAPLYNLLLTKSKLRTTLGKKIFAIYPQTLDGQPVGILRMLCHYVVSTIPVIPFIFIISVDLINGMLKEYQAIARLLQKSLDVQYPSGLMMLSIIVIVVWYGLVLFTKKRLTVHDLICRVCFVSNGSGARAFNIPFVNEFLGKVFGKLNSIKDNILKK